MFSSIFRLYAFFMGFVYPAYVPFDLPAHAKALT